jgi:hypothetical protein
MSSLGTSSADTGMMASATSSEVFTSKNNAGLVPSIISTETFTLPKIDFKKRFAQFNPLLNQGISFPLHDDIDHSLLSLQSGSISTSAFDDYMNSVHPPVYLIELSLFLFAYIPFVFVFYDYFDLATVYFLHFYAMSILGHLLKMYLFTEFFLLLWKWFRDFTRPTLTPQMGVRTIDPYFKEAIQVWCLFESLKDAKSKRGMMAAITQYLQAHTKESLPFYLYNKAMSTDYISDWTSPDGVSQIEGMLVEAFGAESLEDVEDDLMLLDPQDGDVPWHKAIDLAFNNWKEFRSSTIATKFTHLINVIVSAGMCSTANLSFKLGSVALFTPIVCKKQLASADVFEAFYEAVSGFMKGGWRVFKTGEVSAFFVEDDKITEFDDMFNQIKAWHGYALAGNLREYTDIDDNEYENRVNKAIELGDNLLGFIKRSQTFERKYVQDRLDKLRDNLTNFIQLRTRGGLRIAPFAVSLFGQSGCGKSSLTNLTINAGLVYNGLSADKDRIATWADNDKFASSVRSHINAIIFDDFANTKEDFMDFSPAYRLIQVINNIRYLAPMADVFLKGKVSLNPYFCLISTNIECLNAQKYSNEPESVLRRMYHVKVVPKEEFCTSGTLDSQKITEKFGQTQCPDIWYLTVRRYVASNKRFVEPEALVPIEFEGKPLKDISVKEYLKWVQVASKEHFKHQQEYLQNQDSLPTVCEQCKTCYCDCPPVLTPEAGEWRYSAGVKAKSFCDRKLESIQHAYSVASTSSAIAAEELCQMWQRVDFIPESFVCHPKILKFCLFFWKDDLKQSLYSGLIFIFLFCLGLCLQFPRLSVLWVITLFPTMYCYVCTTVQTYQHMIRDRILDLKDVVKTYVNNWQFKYAIIGLGAISLVLVAMRSRHVNLETHTGLNPDSIEEVNVRNDRVNPWLVADTTRLPMSEPSKTTTSENLASSMNTNLVGIVSDQMKTTLGFYITSNFLLIPTHYAKAHKKKDFLITVYKNGGNKVGSSFRDKLCLGYSVQIPNTDFTLCYVTSGGSMKDMRKFLPEGNNFARTSAKLITRGIQNSTLTAIPTLLKGSSMVSHTECTFVGSYYNLPQDTKSGMCMSPVISDGRGSTILGFHLGGKGRLGGCGTVTADEIEVALGRLSDIDGVVLSASSGALTPNMGDFPMTTFGKKILEATTIHPKSAVNFLEEGSNLDMYGQVAGKSTAYSRVAATMISESVTKVFGVSQQWGAPKLRGKGVYPYQATLVHAAIPSLPLGSILVKAVHDYKNITTGIKERIPELFIASPLSRVATVSGLTGVKFIDAMNFNTSPGFPLRGSKHHLLEDLDPELYPEWDKPRTFTKEVWDEFDSVVSILREGKRCYVIWKSCLKDEATKLTKDKVRVFQSAPLVVQLLVRMYFLPIVRIIQMNPAAYECAVGINAEGLEWEELWDISMSKGRERVLAGDYSKYDVRMPAQITIAAFDILIDIARKCDGYSDEDIQLMQMMVNEVVYPVMAYNGDLIQLFGTNPSGQNLTVIINSVANSLLLRCGFFTMYPDEDFKENCAFMTYGDDVMGSVTEKCDNFNHISYANYLSEHDMKFTMPDKESTPTKYMNEEDVDFLKRKCVFNEDLGQKVGLLSEDSIFKRLHAHLLSKELTLPMHSAQNIESSLHDWFYYGREVFEDRKSKLQQVATECEILHLCPALEISYDERVDRWRQKYLGEEVEEPAEPVVLTEQCGDLMVGTYDYLDHCIGSSADIFFWWEHWAATFSLVLLHPILWYCLYNGYEFKVGQPTFGWILFLVLTRGGQLGSFPSQIIRNLIGLYLPQLWTGFINLALVSALALGRWNSNRKR